MALATETGEARGGDGAAETLLRRGRALFAEGRLEEADGVLRAAVVAAPLAPAGHANRALVAQRRGRPAAAAAAARRAALLEPGREAFWRFLGGLAVARSDGAAAVPLFIRAVRSDPGAASGWAALGEAMAGSGRGGAGFLRAGLCLDPAMLAATVRLASEEHAAGGLARADAILRRAETLDPASPVPPNNRATMLREAGRHDDAAAVLRAGASRMPGETGLWRALSIVRMELGQLAAARSACRRTLLLTPGAGDAYFRRAHCYMIGRAWAEAERAARPATIVAPEAADTWRLIGDACWRGGRPDEARAAYRACLARDPDNPMARLGLAETDIPPVPRDSQEVSRARQGWSAGLAAFAAAVDWQSPEAAGRAASALAQYSAFHLAYLSHDDVAIRAAHGGLLARAMAAAHPELAAPAVRRRRRGERLRIGVVSGFIRWHAVWKVLGGWWTHLDPGRFETFAYSYTRHHDDVTEAAQRAFAHFLESPLPPAGLARRILADELDALVYPELGMHPSVLELAGLRLAPVQAMAWGHPVTSGLPTIDWYLSSELMEPADGERYYTESLVRLPNLAITYRPSSRVPEPFAVPVADPAAGIVKVLCAQTLHKLMPAYDDLFPRIARAAPEARFLFFSHAVPSVGRIFSERLARAFEAHGLDATRFVSFVPRQVPPRYAHVLASTDLFFDSIGFSGFNTTLEAVEFGVPVVTCPLGPMRGRQSAAILHRIGIPELAARSVDEYVEMTVALVRDAAARRALAERTRAGAGFLYGDLEPVRALERFLETTAGRP